ncbi:hypothetical protein BC828DRAFT_372500 [Blastocladiella britannica]|nr:hypothetical protein BC828DRAFT_372500 [Blastocladiella britannica]
MANQPALTRKLAVGGHLALAALVVGVMAVLSTLLRSSAYPSIANNDQAQTVGPWTVDFSTAAATAHVNKITAAEHAQPSAANWDVRKYLLEQAQALASSPQGVARGVQIDAPITNANQSAWTSYPLQDTDVTFTAFGTGAPQFIESSNIYIRIPGLNEKATGDRTALLLSAHFDSVPTAKGVGDNAMGTAAMLEVARLATQQPLTYSLIINLNNGEEVGLYGAHLMVRHPWWKDVAAFINADAVCPTGRPMLYRSTSRQLIKIYKENVAFPHGSVIGQEVMAAGLIKSDTDYSVYAGYNVTGIDFAFYDRRAVYHTDLDAMNLFTPESIAHLGNDVLGVLAGINATGIDYVRTAPEKKNVAFMDFAGRSMLVASYPLLFGIGIGTTLVAILGAVVVWFQRRRANTRVSPSAAVSPSYSLLKATLVMAGALLATILVPLLCLFVAFKLSPYAVSGRPILALVTAQLGALLASALVAWLIKRYSAMATGVPAHLGLAVVWTFMLVVATAGARITGFVTHLYWFGALYSLLAFAGYSWIRKSEAEVDQHRTGTLEKAGARPDYDVVGRLRTRGNLLLTAHFALATSWPAFVALDSALLYMYALSPNVQEGMNSLILAAFAAIMAFPVALNAVPLYIGAGKRAAGSAAVILAVATLGCVLWLGLAFPFTQAAPMKLQYSFKRELNATVSFASVTGATDPIGAAIPLTQTVDPVLTLANVPFRAGVPDKLAAVFPSLACDADAKSCTLAPSALGFANPGLPNATWTMRAPSAAAKTNGTAAELEISAPAGMLACLVYGLDDLDVKVGGGGYVALVVPPGKGDAAPAPQSAVTNTVASKLPEFGVLSSDPTVPTTVRVGVPASLVAPGAPAWDLRCVIAVNDGPEGKVGDYLAVYKKVLSRVPEWVSITRGRVRGLAGTALTLSFKP